MHILEAGHEADGRPLVLLLHGFPELAWSWRKVLPPLAAAGAAPAGPGDIQAGLAALSPPRKHYQWYYSTRQADGDMLGAAQGLRDFLRAYYHVKSAGWAGNQPGPLGAWSAAELARLPAYYVMPAEASMPEAVAPFMPSAAQVAACGWLTGTELEVYRAEFARTGFQGGLQWYRCATSGLAAADLRLHAGRAITVPALFIAGAADWGTYQVPGAYEHLDRACADLRGRHLVPGAGHWVQQEQAPAVTRLLLDFLGR
jgi:pimeloyl-ACP methyl ester carboxylesterase